MPYAGWFKGCGSNALYSPLSPIFLFSFFPFLPNRRPSYADTALNPQTGHLLFEPIQALGHNQSTCLQ